MEDLFKVDLQQRGTLVLKSGFGSSDKHQKQKLTGGFFKLGLIHSAGS